jgi:protein gp37
MPGETTIEWTRSDDGSPGRTWNPVTGCTKVSAGCDHCYAERFAERFRGVAGHPYEQGFDLKLWSERLDRPLRWKAPKRIFTNSMSDLWHADVPEAFIADVFAVMSLARWHTFMVLTKRPRRMQRLLTDQAWLGSVSRRMQVIAADQRIPNAGNLPFPVPNVWLGVSVENQEAAYRIDWLVQTPAAVRFLSCEPLIGRLNIETWLWLTRPSTAGPWTDALGRRRGGGGIGGQTISRRPANDLHWVIAGGESGPGHRACDPRWIEELRDTCVDAEVPFFFKQWGGLRPKSGGRELDGCTWDEFPEVIGA